MCNKRHSINCIIPPYIFDSINNSYDNNTIKTFIDSNRSSNYNREERIYKISQLKTSIGWLKSTANKARYNATKALHSIASMDTTSKLVRKIYNAENTEDKPGRLVRKEGDEPIDDIAVNEVYDAVGEVFDFYSKVHDRSSIDGLDMEIIQIVHYGKNFNNALWDGMQMIYGDGDEEVFGRFTSDLDVIGHELTHGVIIYEANLNYSFQSGALNESYADIFGSLIKQRKLKQEAKGADWLIGANILIGPNNALRSLKAPGTAFIGHSLLGDDPQFPTMDQYQNLSYSKDYGGVHINSGIPNHAFYLAAIEIGGNAWEKAGVIWYHALINKLKSNATFIDAAKATIASANKLFGTGSLETKAVNNAWKAVKVI